MQSPEREAYRFVIEAHLSEWLRDFDRILSGTKAKNYVPPFRIKDCDVPLMRAAVDGLKRALAQAEFVPNRLSYAVSEARQDASFQRTLSALTQPESPPTRRRKRSG